MKRIDITGKRYGRLTVIEYHSTNKSFAYWLCLCDCGNSKAITGASLKAGLCKSCGCLRKEITTTKTHGESHKTKEYRAWAGIKSRCYTRSDKRYKNYGAIGIIVCDRWKYSYENFLIDVGRAPSNNHSIDRIDVTGNYEPSNCRWATDDEQANNKTNTFWVEFQGQKMSLANWAKEKRVNYKTLHKYIKYKHMTFEEAIIKLTKPI